MFDMLTENRFRTRPVNKSCVWIMLFVFSIALVASAQTTEAQTTTFTFQGRLTDAGAPANGAHDFEFKLYDAAGAQVGATLTRDDVVVTDGVFRVELDFGVSPFASATASTLEIGVRPGASTGAFTTLSPRQSITSSPYAIKTLSAEQLGGVAANQYVQTNDPRLSDERPPAPGSSNYIQSNPAAQQAGASFNISGDGVAAGTLSGALVNAATQYTLSGQRVLSATGTGGGNTSVGIDAGISISSGTGNSFVGWGAGSQNTSGSFNSFIGAFAGRLNTEGYSNTFVGDGAGEQNTIGNENSIFGTSAGRANTTGSQNSYFGVQAGFSNQTGGSNSFFGRRAGYANTADFNAFFGAGAGELNTSGTDNTFVGTSAGGNNVAGSKNSFLGRWAGRNNTANDNAFFGSFAGQSNSTGGQNAFFGAYAGSANTDAGLNSFFGFQSGINNTTGCCNSFFGNLTGVLNTTGFANSFFGGGAGGEHTTGFRNTLIGDLAGNDNFEGTGLTTGNRNTFVGSVSGRRIATGSSNTFVGVDTTGTPDIQFASAFGSNATVTTNDTIVIGKAAGTYYGVARPADTVIIPGNVNVAGNLIGGQVVKSLNGLIDNVTLAAGSGITLTPGGNTVTIAATGGGGSSILNQTAQQASANFNIDGSGAADTFNAATQYNIGGQRVLSATGTGLGNTSVGIEAGASISTGTDNAFVGWNAGTSNSQGSSNSFFGSDSGSFNTTGSGNTFAGTASGKFNRAGSNNSFYGIRAGLSNTTGNNNTFVGVDAGQSNGGGSANSFFGLFAGANNTTGVTNSFFGVNAGFGNTTGGFNSFFGAGAGSRNTTGEANTFVGIGAGQVNTIGSDNAFFGNNAGVDNLSGSNITLVGAGSNVGLDNLTNATAIGASAIVSASNSLVLGNNANVGIGTSAPGSKLTVVGLVESTTGGVKFPDGTIQTTAAAAGSITDITAGAGLTGGGNTGNLTLDVGAGAGINVAADTISIADLGVKTTMLANSAVTSPKIAASQVVKSLTVGASTLRDDLTLAPGSGITLTPAGNTVTIAATGGGGGPPAPGSPNYIQNTTTTQTGANFNISGSGTVGGTLSATNVGIGTATPNHRLSIEGSGFTESSIRSTNERSILSLDSQVGGQRRIWTLESGVLGFPRWFGIYDRTAAQPRLMIAPNGNVGIGTGTPLLFSKLTVNGNILALGNVNALAVNAADIVAGNLTVQALGPAGNRPLCLNSRNLIASCTASSLRYKTDLQPFFDGLRFINQLRPISYKWKSDAALDVGFGAEDVARVNPLFATYNDKGEVEGVKYDRLSVVFVNAIKEQQAQIERQQQQIDELKKLVCHAYPAAELCKQ